MLRAGYTQTLNVNRISDYGLFLADDEGNEVLLPNRYVSLENRIGDQIEVFIYHDSENRLVASTETPLLHAGQAGYLKVVDKNLHGAFLEWGLFGKDLFLPNRNQTGGVLTGNSYVVYLYVDNVTGRCVATMKLKQFIDNDEITVRAGEQVEILIASESPIGYRVIVGNRHWGMIYRNQVFRPVAVGERMPAWVHRITEDNRIDLTLRQQGYTEVRNGAQELLEMLRAEGGFLPLCDESSPAQIAQRTTMSKKMFKRSLGVLLKQGKAVQQDGGIKLTEKG